MPANQYPNHRRGSVRGQGPSYKSHVQTVAWISRRRNPGLKAQSLAIARPYGSGCCWVMQ